MPALTGVSLDEYLNTSYRPDCDYLEGEILERNVGEWDHSRLQMLLSRYLSNREDQWGILVVPEQRVQVKVRRFRVPDITVLKGSRPAGGIVTEPPYLCIEILSPDDRVQETQDKIDDYLSFGVRYVWVINPRTQRAHIHTAEGIREVKDGVLTTKDPDISVSLSEIESR
jgi:Uma2 family endonuclease